MPMVLLDPEPEVRTKRLALAPRLAAPSAGSGQALDGKTVGLLEDARGRSVDHGRIPELLAQRFRLAGVLFRRKPNMSRVSPPALLEEMARACDAVICATCQ